MFLLKGFHKCNGFSDLEVMPGKQTRIIEKIVEILGQLKTLTDEQISTRGRPILESTSPLGCLGERP